MRGKVKRYPVEKNDRRVIEGFLFRPRWLPLYGRKYWVLESPETRQFRWLERSSIVQKYIDGLWWGDFCWGKEGGEED